MTRRVTVREARPQPGAGLRVTLAERILAKAGYHPLTLHRLGLIAPALRVYKLGDPAELAAFLKSVGQLR